MSQTKDKSTRSSRKDKKQLKQFCFGSPLDQLPNTYVPDFGNVVTFLVESGEIIRRHVEVEGLFRKSADLSHQEEWKLRAERGERLGELDVHEVTCLVKTFFRLLPEPLLPCLFHGPFLSSMDLQGAEQTEAVQSLCFALPALHLSCLRYFMNLLAHIASHEDKNRMSACNLAVVLTPSLIRLKSRTKLMSPEELRVLPKQTALVEYLICHAEGIGCMTSHVYRHSMEMAEELLRKKLGPKKKKKGKLWTNLEQRLGAARAALSVVATLHFRPNTSVSVSDTILVDGPYGQAVTASSLLQSTSVSSEPELASRPNGNRKADNTKKRLLLVFPIKTYSERPKRRSERRRRNNKKCSKAAAEKPESKVMLVPVIQSWSRAIPVIPSSGNGDSDLSSCSSEDSSWSDEEASHSDASNEQEMMAEDGGQGQNEDPLLAESKKDSCTTENLTNGSSETKKRGGGLFCSDDKDTDKAEEKEWKCASEEISHKLLHPDKHSKCESLHNPDHTMVSELEAHKYCSVSDKTNTTKVTGKGNDEHGTSTETDTSLLPKEESSQSKMVDRDSKGFNEHVEPSQEPLKENLEQLTYDRNQRVEVFQVSEHSSKSECQHEGKCLFDGKEPETSDHSQLIGETAATFCNALSADNVTRGTNSENSSYCPLKETTDRNSISTVQKDPSPSPPEQSETQRTDSKTINQHSENALADSKAPSQYSQSVDAICETLNEHSQRVGANHETFIQCSQNKDADGETFNQYAQSVDADRETLDEHSQTVDSSHETLIQCSQNEDADGETFNQHSQSGDVHRETPYQHSEIADNWKLLFTGSSLSMTSLLEHIRSNFSATKERRMVKTQPAGRLKHRLLQQAQRGHSLNEQQPSAARSGKLLRQKWTENRLFVSERIVSDAAHGSSLLKTNNEFAVSKPNRSMSTQYEISQCELGHLHASFHPASSPDQNDMVPYDMKHLAHDQFQQLQPDSDYTEFVSQQQLFSCGMENVPSQFSDCYERFTDTRNINRSEELTARMRRVPVSNTRMPVQNVSVCVPRLQYNCFHDTTNFSIEQNHRLCDGSTSANLPPWLSHEMQKRQDKTNEVYNNLPVECNCCRISPPKRECMLPGNSLSNSLCVPNQYEPLNYHRLGNRCADINLSEGCSSRDRQSQVFDQCSPFRNEMVPNYSSFHRFSYGFESLHPSQAHCYGANAVSECAFVEEGSGCTADTSQAHKQYYRQFLTTVSKEVSGEENETHFEKPTLPGRTSSPDSCSHSIVRQKSFETFFAQENHIQNECVKCKEDYRSTWIVHGNDGAREQKQDTRRLHCAKMNPGESPCLAMCTDMGINDQTRNWWNFHAEGYTGNQSISPERNIVCPGMYPSQVDKHSYAAARQTETARNEEERSYSGFQGFHDVSQHSDRSYQHCSPDVRFDYKDNFHPMDRCTEINSHGSVKPWNEHRASNEAARICNSMQTKQCEINEGFVSYITVHSENDLWNENLKYNSKESMKQREESHDDMVPCSSPRKSPLTSFASSGPLQNMDAMGHMSNTAGSPNVYNQHKCSSVGFNDPQSQHLQEPEPTQIRYIPEWSRMNQEVYQICEPDVPSPNSPQLFNSKPQSSQLWDSEQQPQSYCLPFRSDVPFETKPAAVDLQELNSLVASGNNDEEKAKAPNDFTSNANHTQAGQICGTNIETNTSEPLMFANGQTEKTENHETQNKAENIYNEAKENQQDSTLQSISPHHHGDGQKGLSPDPAVVVVSNSPRKHRRKSPGTINKVQNTDTLTEKQERNEKEKTEELIDHMEMLCVQEEHSEQQDQDKVCSTNMSEEENTSLEHAIEKRQVNHGNHSEEIYTVKSKLSPVLQASTLISDEVTATTAESDTENMSKNNTNSSNITCSCSTGFSSTLPPMSLCLQDIHVLEFDSSVHRHSGNCGWALSTTTYMQDNLITSSNCTGPSNLCLHQDAASRWFHTAAARRRNIRIPASPGNGFHLDPSSPYQIIPQLEMPGNVYSVYDVGKESKTPPRWACFEPEGDIILR